MARHLTVSRVGKASRILGRAGSCPRRRCSDPQRPQRHRNAHADHDVLTDDRALEHLRPWPLLGGERPGRGTRITPRRNMIGRRGQRGEIGGRLRPMTSQRRRTHLEDQHDQRGDTRDCPGRGHGGVAALVAEKSSEA